MTEVCTFDYIKATMALHFNESIKSNLKDTHASNLLKTIQTKLKNKYQHAEHNHGIGNSSEISDIKASYHEGAEQVVEIGGFLKEFLINEDEDGGIEEGINIGNYLDDKVTIDRWARTRRQKVIKDISFESEAYNIYDPHFTSEDEHEDSLLALEAD